MMKTNWISLPKKKYGLLLLVLCSFGCAREQVSYTASGQEILWEQGNVSLFRNKPHIWPAKGKAILTEKELQFVPTPYYWVFNIHGTDTTSIHLSDITELEKEKWMLIYPFKLDVITKDGTHHPFVTWRRNKLAHEIQRAKE